MYELLPFRHMILRLAVELDYLYVPEKSTAVLWIRTSDMQLGQMISRIQWEEGILTHNFYSDSRLSIYDIWIKVKPLWNTKKWYIFVFVCAFHVFVYFVFFGGFFSHFQLFDFGLKFHLIKGVFRNGVICLGLCKDPLTRLVKLYQTSYLFLPFISCLSSEKNPQTYMSVCTNTHKS